MVKWSIELDEWLHKPSKALTEAERAEIAEYEKTCWTCRGMGGAHYLTEIICAKHAADRAYFEATGVRGVDLSDVLELGRLSEALDAVLRPRVEAMAQEVTGFPVAALRGQVTGSIGAHIASMNFKK